jgi:hypothetical protein
MATADYRRHVVECRDSGREPMLPGDREQHVILAMEWASMARRLKPAKAIAKYLNLPLDYPEEPPPLSEREQERLLRTLRDDEDFRVAVRHFLLGGGG